MADSYGENNMKAGENYIGVGCGAIILNDKKEILLIKRKAMSKDRTTSGMWSVPGGETEFGEKVEDAIIREVREEIGVDVEIVRHIGHHDQILESSKVHWHCNSFLCRIKEEGVPRIMEEEKSEKVGWFPIDKVPKDCGIAHIIVPLHKLGLISNEEYNKRVKETQES